tara:strand:- start:76 stop:1467 length:1392 start_codon:yes stop_codon:yes gene_type:complete
MSKFHAIVKNTEALSQMNNGLKKLSTKFVSNVNAVSQLTKVFNTSEKLQLKSLAMGTTYAQFTAANTNALKGNIATQQEMTDFLMGSFAKGLRDASKSTLKLADDMIATGQNTEGLISAMGGLRLLTKDSNKIGGTLSKAMKDNTSNYGVNAENMISALQAVKSSLEQASIYGDDAVGAFGEAAVTLKAAMGGAEGADKQIGIFLGMADSLNLAQQQQLGLFDIMKDLRGGITPKLEDIISAGESLKVTLTKNDMVADSTANVFGKAQVQSLLFMTNSLTKQNELSEEMKAGQQSMSDTLATQQRRVAKFYETYAPKQYESIVKWLPQIALAVGAGSAAAGMGKSFKGLAKAARWLGPIGMAIGAGIPLIASLLSDTDDTAKDTNKVIKKSTKKEKEAGRAFKANTLSQAARLASGLVKGGTRSENKRLITALEAIVKNDKDQLTAIQIQEAVAAGVRAAKED